jgi:hypothetical protein
MKKEDFLKIVRSKSTKDLTEQELSFLGSIGEAVEGAFQADSVTRKKEIEDLTGMLGTFDNGESAAKVIRSLAAKVDEIEARAKRGFSNEEKYKLRTLLEGKKDEIQRAMKGGAPWEIEFKAKRAASALMTTATVLSGASAVNTTNLFDDMDIAVFRYPANFIIDVIGGVQVSKVPQTWQWKEEGTAGDGVPTVVSEGAAKPLVDKKFIWKYATRKKFAGRVEMTEEVEIDFEQLVMDITAMFERDVIIAWQDSVLAEIIAWVPAYTATALDGTIVNPTVYSCIGALKLAVQVQNYEPDVVFLNPGDAAEAIYLQDNSGNQQFIPAELQYGGLRPIVSNKITAGTLIVGSSRLIQEKHSNFILRKGVHGDQFIENESTIVGEVFSNLKLATEYKKGWCQGSIAVLKAALQKGV